jgi:hypothetical protein
MKCDLCNLRFTCWTQDVKTCPVETLRFMRVVQQSGGNPRKVLDDNRITLDECEIMARLLWNEDWGDLVTV